MSELDPAYHQTLIDEQGVQAGRYAYYIDKDLYAMILAAPRRTRLERRPGLPWPYICTRKMTQTAQ